MPRTGLFAALGNAFQVVFQNLFTVFVLAVVSGGLGTLVSDFVASTAVRLFAPDRGRPELLVSELTRTVVDLGWGSTVGALTAACTLYLWVQRERGQSTNFYDALNYGLNRWSRMWVAHAGALVAVQLGMLVIVPGILFGLQYAFVDAIATLDAKEPNPGERSRKLTARRRGLIFSTFAIFGLWWIPYQGLLMFMIQDPNAFLGGALHLSEDTVKWVGPLLMPTAGVVNGLVLVLLDLCMVQYYLDLFRKPANAGAEGGTPPSATPPPTPVEGTDVGGSASEAAFGVPQYLPQRVSSNIARTGLGPTYRYELHTDCEVRSFRFTYNFLLYCFPLDSEEPVLVLASESSSGDPVLGMFSSAGHSNFGSSARWLDQEAFFEEASRIADRHLAKLPVPAGTKQD